MTKLIFSMLFAFSMTAFANSPTNPALTADMKVIASTYETLGKQIDNKAKNAESEKLVDTLLEKSNAAIKMTPANITKLTGKEQETAMKKYKDDMNTMITHLKEIKTALSSGNNAQAKTHFLALKPWTNPAHKVNY